MLELTRQEAVKLKSTLSWVLDATLDGKKERAIIGIIRDKISNILKSNPKKQRISIILSEEDEIN